MGLSKLSEKCKNCQYVESCNHKRMETLAYLKQQNMADATSQSCINQIAAPVLRETMKIRVDGKPLTVYKDDFEKNLYKSLYSGLELHFGA